MLFAPFLFAAACGRTGLPAPDTLGPSMGGASGAAAGSGGQGSTSARDWTRVPCEVAEQPGPLQVTAVGDGRSYCIDATEVTNAQYAEFFDALGGSLPAQPPHCAWNDDLEPSAWHPGQLPWPFPAERMNHPVARVDFCDAAAYCAWAGKRVCGGLENGEVYRGWRGEPSEWVHACTALDTQPYPYGPEYEPGRCFEYDGSALADLSSVPVATLPCEGGLPGMFDMLGNIAEWDASCSGETGGEDGCTIRGGSFFIPVPGYDCSEITSLQRKLRADFVGFRCCRDYVQ